MAGVEMNEMTMAGDLSLAIDPPPIPARQEDEGSARTDLQDLGLARRRLILVWLWGHRSPNFFGPRNRRWGFAFRLRAQERCACADVGESICD